MSRIKLIHKIVPFFLIISIFFTACDVPDISKFTEASAEMTKGIRLGVKETGGILETVAKSNIASDNAKSAIEKSSREYNKNIAPTLKALDSLDSYLEALNALAQANKKSEENAKALITSVGNLTSAVAGLELPETAIKLGTVAVTLFNQFKTAKNFEKRVELVELIVNGKTADTSQPCTVQSVPETTRIMRESLEAMFPPDRAARTSIEMSLRLRPGVSLEQEITNLKTEIERLESELNGNGLTPAQQDEKQTELDGKERRLELLRNGLKRIQNIFDRRITSLNEKQREEWLSRIDVNFCGVIDILKLNMQELDNIQRSGLMLLYSNTADDNKALLRYYRQININDERVQSELGLMLEYKTQRENLKELIVKRSRTALPAEIISLDSSIEILESRIGSTLNAISVMDDVIKVEVDREIAESDRLCRRDPACLRTPVETKKRHDKVKSSTIFVTVLEDRERVLLAENARLIGEAERVDAKHKDVQGKLKAIEEKQKQMNALFETVISALDTWGETHSNLRLSLNTKKPLTAARLFSKAKEIFEILKPKEETNA